MIYKFPILLCSLKHTTVSIKTDVYVGLSSLTTCLILRQMEPMVENRTGLETNFYVTTKPVWLLNCCCCCFSTFSDCVEALFKNGITFLPDSFIRSLFRWLLKKKTFISFVYVNHGWYFKVLLLFMLFLYFFYSAFQTQSVSRPTAHVPVVNRVSLRQPGLPL